VQLLERFLVDGQPVAAKRESRAVQPDEQELVRVGAGVVNSQGDETGGKPLRSLDPEVALGDPDGRSITRACVRP
jgi:hypothetical protein